MSGGASAPPSKSTGASSRGGTVLALALLVAAGCSGEDGSPERAAEPSTTTKSPETSTTAAPIVDADLRILVTNDDGVRAEGIDTLVAALGTIESVSVTVVAPAVEQSGTGGKVTDGPLTSAPARTAGGHEATAVEGFPSDAIRVAIDDLGLQPDLVISGINKGQNVGPLVEVSGTVGAARAAAQRGVPALAVSQGLGEPPDFEAGAELAVLWVEEHRDAVVAGELSTDTVVNLNVPTCERGELRGTLEVALAPDLAELASPSDCTSTVEGFTDDVAALTNGYATITNLSVEPAATPAG